MNIIIFFLKSIRKIIKTIREYYSKIFSFRNKKFIKSDLYENYVQYYNKEANSLVKSKLREGKPVMISKFGTIELSTLANYKSRSQSTYYLKDYIDYLLGNRDDLWWENNNIMYLCRNAGFFPPDVSLIDKYYKINIDAIKEINILGSYLKEESYFSNELKTAIRINIEGYYSPFFYDDPWTKLLKGKRVLVIHPFSDTIQHQYKNRRKIWQDDNILPDFDLVTIKAVQTIANEKSVYETWFDALDYMKFKIASTEFDIAIIGCGAYGMPLAAYVKLLGKQAVHLAGWTQVLFGIKGKRWENDPRVSKYINEYWVSPSKEETVKDFQLIENGCYW